MFLCFCVNVELHTAALPSVCPTTQQQEIYPEIILPFKAAANSCCLKIYVCLRSWIVDLEIKALSHPQKVIVYAALFTKIDLFLKNYSSQVFLVQSVIEVVICPSCTEEALPLAFTLSEIWPLILWWVEKQITDACDRGFCTLDLNPCTWSKIFFFPLRSESIWYYCAFMI